MTSPVQTSYFHVCPVLLEEGAVIKPGNFGRVIEQYRVGNLSVMAVRELCFEIIRLRHYAAHPSRMSCLFLFHSLDTALQHVQRSAPTNVVYEVELTDPDATLFHGDMSLISTTQPNEADPIIVFNMNLGAYYWSGRAVPPDEGSEFLTNSPARVIRMIDHRIEVSDLAARIHGS